MTHLAMSRKQSSYDDITINIYPVSAECWYEAYYKYTNYTLYYKYMNYTPQLYELYTITIRSRCLKYTYKLYYYKYINHTGPNIKKIKSNFIFQ